MSPGLAERAVALAGVALLGAMLALAIAYAQRERPQRPRLPEAVPATGGGWYTALAAPQELGDGRRRSACGLELTPSLRGVAHPVLPCGTKLYVAGRDVHVLTQVVARRPEGSGPQFGLTAALARDLGVRGVGRIRWRFARAR